MPFLLIKSVSILSKPTPNLLTTFRDGSFSITSFVKLSSLTIAPSQLLRKDISDSSSKWTPSLLYLTLEKYGLLKDIQVEKEFLSDGGILGGHPDRLNQYGIEISSGSLGYGLSIGSGVALSAKKNNRESRAFILLGDGECNEGMIWEAVMFASHHRLDNLVAIVDYNNLQGLGYIKDILNLSPLSNKFSSFDWNVREIDGNNIDELLEVFDDLPFKRNMPSVIIANTVKGKGISSMENKLHSHYEVLNEERYKIIMNELDNIILN